MFLVKCISWFLYFTIYMHAALWCLYKWTRRQNYFKSLILLTNCETIYSVVFIDQHKNLQFNVYMHARPYFVCTLNLLFKFTVTKMIDFERIWPV